VKDIELKMVSALMKNSRRSDRELARALDISQPRASRIIKKLEKAGIVREYTMIPDFAKLGYEIMGITSLNVTEKSGARFEEMRDATVKAEKNNPHAGLMIVNGAGSKKNRVFIDFYQNYSAYTKVMTNVKQFPFTDIDSLDTVMVDLKEKENYRIISMSAIADHLLSMIKRKNEVQA